MNQSRILIIDNHVIAQFHDGIHWWTCSKANNNDEQDFAVWPFSEFNLNKAVHLVGNVPVVQSECKPIQRGNSWYTDANDTTPKGYLQALRWLGFYV